MGLGPSPVVAGLASQAMDQACVALLAGAPFGLRACKAGNAGAELDAALTDWFAGDAVATVGRRVLSLGEGWNNAAVLREALLIHLSGTEDP